MPLNFALDNKELFHLLYNAGTEEDVQNIVDKFPDTFNNKNWKPVGDNYSNYGIIENQQSNPIAALVEKVTNSIKSLVVARIFTLASGLFAPVVFRNAMRQQQL